MLHGDISNQRGYIIGVRYDGTLVSHSNNVVKNLVDKVLHTDLSYDINYDTLNILNYIYRRTEHTVVLVVKETEDKFTSLKDMENLFPFEILKVKNESEITMQLLTGDMTYYIDDDDYRRSLVNNEYAITSTRFNEILRRKGRSGYGIR